MKNFTGRKICIALAVNVFFVLKQLGLFLVFCAVFHSHTHDFCQEKIVIKAVDCSICSIHCCSNDVKHIELNDISQAPMPEEKTTFFSGTDSGVQPSEQFRYFAERITRDVCLVPDRHYTVLFLRSMVLRC